MLRNIAVLLVAILATTSLVHSQNRVDANTQTASGANEDQPEFELVNEANKELEQARATPPWYDDRTSETADAGSAPDQQQAQCDIPSELLTSSHEGPVPIIFDTDFGPDVDDVGALAILHALADSGEAEILGVMVSTFGGYGPQAVDVVNTYYGRPDIPIGLADPSAPSKESKYAEQLAKSFENDDVSNPDSTSLYRKLLAEQPDNSVTILSVGFQSNLDDLLLSGPDESSPLNGAELVAEKVKLWVAMAGQFPSSDQNPTGAEYNLVQDLPASIITATLWPTPVVFSGFEVGAAIRTGSGLATDVPPDNPVREAYRLYTGGDSRESWDLTAVWYAVRGSDEFFDICPGRIKINADGSDGWDHHDTAHGYLIMRERSDVIAATFDELMTRPPGGSHQVGETLTVELVRETE